MSEKNRDTGLVRAVGTWGLTASIFNNVVGAGIFVVPAALAASLGAYAPAAFLVCAVSIGTIAICFAEGGSRIPTSGGAYGYIEGAFGPLAGYVAGMLLWFSAMLANGGVAAALADVTASVAPTRWASTAHALTIIGLIGGIAWVNTRGVAEGVRLVDAATMFKLVPLGVFLLACAGAMHRSNFVTSTPTTSASVSRALILALFAFSGMEIAVAASGEVEQPARTIPRALALGMAFITVLYVAIQTVAQGTLGPALAASNAPLADAMARAHPTLRWLMLAGAGISMFGYISASLLANPRTLFALARDGFLPRVLGRVHPKSHTPYVAILCYAALAMGLALTGTFAELAVLSMLAMSVLYIGACAAAWQLARRGVALAGAPLNFKWLGAAATIGIASMLAMIALASRVEIVGLLALVGASVLIYLVQTRSLAGRRDKQPGEVATR